MKMQKNVKRCGTRDVLNMLKVGVIGAGKRYHEMYKSVFNAFKDRIQIIGFVTKSGKISEEVGNYKSFTSIRELCNVDKPDFLVSIVPHHQNISIIKDACELKCNILVETPVSDLDLSQFILDKVEASGITAGVVEQWPFLPLECFKKKLIDSGLLGNIYLAENDYRAFKYHGIAILRNYLDKNSNFTNIAGRVAKNYPLNGRGDEWNIRIGELDNGKTLLYKYTGLYKKVDVRNFKSLRVYGSKGTIISGCLLDNEVEKFSIIWDDNKTYHLDIKKEYDWEDLSIDEINTTLPDGSIFKWENKFKNHCLNEHQIAIAQHIDSMIDGKVLWTLEDGFKDLQIL